MNSYLYPPSSQTSTVTTPEADLKGGFGGSLFITYPAGKS
jgi:hypothetical protein